MTVAKIARRNFIVTAGAALAAPGFVQAASVRTPQGYPSSVIKLVVPHPAGGGVDVVIRKVAAIVSVQIGQTIVIENAPGASGNIGTARVTQAKPDGYTLLAINPTFSYIRYLFKTLPWTPEQEVQPVTTVLRIPDVVVVAGNSPYKTLQDLIADARANPGKLTYGTGGVGSPPHLAGEAFQQAAGVQLTHVPYKGASEVVMGILSDTVTLMVSGVPSFTSYLKSGALRALSIAATNGKRSAAFPNIPTYTEAGLPRLDTEASWSWTGIAVPNGTPPDIVAFLHAAFLKAQETPEYLEYVNAQASLIGGISPRDLVRQTKNEQAYWQTITQKAGLELQ